jgi:hypothetical protein
MANIHKILTATFTSSLLLLAICMAYSCSNEKNNMQENAANEAATQLAEIKGAVKTIVFGKDGYTAEVQAQSGGSYTALVSIVNLGGREHFQQCNIGDEVTFKGIGTEIGGATHLIVKEIVNISPSPINALNAKYQEIQPTDYCWQSNKELELHAQPNAESKVEGRHFEGELLQVLGTKIIDNELWVNVTYKLAIKAGYEDKFADGTVMSSGSPTGWIGGGAMPEINCK